MTLYLSILTFIFGTLIGSFLNVCIYRIPKGESLRYPISHYMSSISIRYIIIVISTGLITLFVIWNMGFSLGSLKLLLLIYWLIVIGVIDLDTTDIYTKTTVSGMLIGVCFIILSAMTEGSTVSTWDFVLGGLTGGGLIALIVLLTNGMGWGDAELFFMCGLFIGFKLTILALLLSFIIGAIVGLTLIATKKKTRKDYIPFGPYIALAVIISTIYGNRIIELYFSL